MRIRTVTALFILAIILTAIFPAAAGAEIVGRTADGYIHRYAADNGQEIYFASTMEETLVEAGTDINFDGYPDLAVITALGMSNAFYEFYLWNGSEYVYVQRDTSDIVNYSLADGKYLVSRSNDGDAGLLFHTQICVWEGNILKTIRIMVSEEEKIITWEDRVVTQTLNPDRLHVTLWSVDGIVGAADVLWEKTYSPLPEDAAVFDEMETHLWEGLR